MDFSVANKTDKADIYSLWSEAFGDSKEIIDFFFNNLLDFDNALVCRENGEIVSMLFLIPAEIAIEEKIYPAYYIYAAATKQIYRKQGIMSALLDFSAEYAKNNNIDFLFLHPANDELYNFYEKNGFQTSFYETVSEISHEEVFSLPDISVNRVVWSKKVMDFNTQIADSEPFSSESGYAQIIKGDNEIVIENLLTANYKQLLEEIFNQTGQKKLTAVLPCGLVKDDELLKTRTGLIRPVGKIKTDKEIFLGISLE